MYGVSCSCVLNFLGCANNKLLSEVLRGCLIMNVNIREPI